MDALKFGRKYGENFAVIPKAEVGIPLHEGSNAGCYLTFARASRIASTLRGRQIEKEIPMLKSKLGEVFGREE
ncbi:MAG: hypothetical protein N3F63_07625 [Thermoplasmata archaeon]|nr:hypothetical protein [Thermoplasmata archaeon]